MLGRKGIRFGGLNSLWFIFYGILVLGILIYTWHDAFTEYGKFSQKPMRSDINDTFTTRLVMNIISVILAPLFIVACCTKVGNYANDGVKLGRDHTAKNDSLPVHLHTRKSIITIIWNHLPPIAPLVHVAISFLVLFSKMFTDGAEIKYGYKPAEFAWNSNADFVFGKMRPKESYVRATITFNTIENSTYIVFPTSTSITVRSGIISAEFINYVIALVTLSVRYAATFWFTNKTLSIIFLSIMLSMCFNLLVSYCALEMAYKVALNAIVYHEIDFKLSTETLLCLDVISGLLVFSATWLVFQHLANLFINKCEMFFKMQNTQSPVHDNRLLEQSFAGYSVHIISMLVLVAISTLRAPVIWCYLSIYNVTKDTLILTTISVSIVYLVLWCLLWILLTVKRDWQFKCFNFLPPDKQIVLFKSGNGRTSDQMKLNCGNNNTETNSKTAHNISNSDTTYDLVTDTIRTGDLSQEYADDTDAGDVFHQQSFTTAKSREEDLPSEAVNSISNYENEQTVVESIQNPGFSVIDATLCTSPESNNDERRKDRYLSSQNSFDPKRSHILHKTENIDNSLSRDSGIHDSCSSPLRERHNSDDFVLANIVKLDTRIEQQNSYPVPSLHLGDSYGNTCTVDSVIGGTTHPSQRLCSEV